MKSTYTTSKAVAGFLLLIAVSGWTIALWDSPFGFQINSITLILSAIIIFLFFDLLWGIKVTLDDKVLSRIDNFVFRKNILLNDIEIIRYQPTYGVGKEVSSLYVFRKEQNLAAITMTSIWFTEKVLRDFLLNIKKLNPSISLDEEARELMERTDDYFDAQKIQLVPLVFGIFGIIAGVLLFIKAQSLISTEFNITTHGLAAASAGLIAGFGTYTLLRRRSLGLFIGVLASIVLLGIYWISTN
jgi:hypothetical protein